MKVTFIADRVPPPYDEGVKNIVRNLICECVRSHDVRLITDSATGIAPQTAQLSLGRLFLCPSLWLAIWKRCDDLLIYIPHGSLTAAAYFRLVMLRLAFPTRKQAIIGLQQRRLSMLGRLLLRLARPHALVVLSEAMRIALLDTEVSIIRFTPGVDLNCFLPIPIQTRDALRSRYGFVPDDFVVLHVGHLKASRNLDPVIEAAKRIGARLMIVASTTFRHEEDPALSLRLQDVGAVVLRDEILDINDIYGLADCYAFPVLVNYGATEMPLSVLEAMAANMPVVTTRYGALPELFAADAGAGYFYADDAESFATMFSAVRALPGSNTRKMVEQLSWERTVSALMRELEGNCRG